MTKLALCPRLNASVISRRTQRLPLEAAEVDQSPLMDGAHWQQGLWLGESAARPAGIPGDHRRRPLADMATTRAAAKARA
jgi:hypothetical protein